MTPLFDPRPWGTHDLSPIYAKTFEEKIGESWLTGDHCRVQNGAFAGRALEDLAVEYGRDLIGTAPADEARFPLLAKFLFPHEKLSVQVHPDDDDARAIGQPCGKTECWYVAHAEPGAELALGLQPGVTRADFQKSIEENRAEELLNWIKVSAGDMIYVAGGTVHTLGPGSIIIETQQQSDTTFRLYDYGRPRELHLKDGLRVIKEKVGSGKVKPQPFQMIGQNGNRQRQLVASSFFVVEHFEMSAAQKFEWGTMGGNSVQVLVAIDGKAVLECEGTEAVTLAKGDAVVVPPGDQTFIVHPEPEVRFLKSYVPGTTLPEPETSIE